MRDRVDTAVTDHFLTIWRARWSVLLGALVAALLLSTLLTIGSGGSLTTSLLQVGVGIPDDGNTTDFRAASIVEAASRRSFREDVQQQTELPLDEILAVEVRQLPFPGFIEVEASASSPERAAELVEAMTTAIIERPLTPGESALELSVVEVGRPTTVDQDRPFVPTFIPLFILALIVAAELSVLARFVRGRLSPSDPVTDAAEATCRPTRPVLGNAILDSAEIDRLIPDDLGTERNGHLRVVALGECEPLVHAYPGVIAALEMRPSGPLPACAPRLDVVVRLPGDALDAADVEPLPTPGTGREVLGSLNPFTMRRRARQDRFRRALTSIAATVAEQPDTGSRCPRCGLAHADVSIVLDHGSNWGAVLHNVRLERPDVLLVVSDHARRPAVVRAGDELWLAGARSVGVLVTVPGSGARR